ncbi:phosphatidylinositol-4-phosphate 5-Kinase domain-containing protein [Sarocladium implicatum]|nr:phosphatidylinositol-4-phosphate 5-Kinase domain-containing protein [Sarocladium implicatum]
MSNLNSPDKPTGSPLSLNITSPISLRNRRGSLASVTTTATVDKEQLASALDKIHTSASQCDSLTTFNDFAPPPASSTVPDDRNTAGEYVQQGLSGLYSRFQKAVGVGSPVKQSHDASEGSKSGSKRSSIADARTSRSSMIQRNDTSASISTMSSQHVQPPDLPQQTATPSEEGYSKPPGISLMSGSKSQASSRQSLPTKATSSVVADPTITSTSSQRDESRSTARSTEPSSPTLSRKSLPTSKVDAPLESPSTSEVPDLYDVRDGKLPPRSKRRDSSSPEGSIDTATSPSKAAGQPLPPIQTHHLRTPSGGSTLLSPDDIRRRPRVVTRLSNSKSSAALSRGSSVDEIIGDAASANSSARHGNYSSRSNSVASAELSLQANQTSQALGLDRRSAQLDKMRRQVLSKEYWMKDDTVKECFLCQTPFSAFRRKHHCRTCGCIFDSKCTTVISGDKFGVQGSLRVCKRCMEVISSRFDNGSGSEESGDEQSFLPRYFAPNQRSKSPTPSSPIRGPDSTQPMGHEGSGTSRPVTTPLMAIPATRRVGGHSSRASAVLEIDAPQLSRPGSSRSLKSLTSGRPHSSAGHKRHHSKHALWGRMRGPQNQTAPFRKALVEETAKKPKFPAFHDDNIIDPELADYMSDDSSGDEQMSIFATMSNDMPSGSYERDKSTFGHYVNSTKRSRHRAEKSISGMSHFSRGPDDFNGPASLVSHRRPARRRNLSNVSGNMHYMPSPRPKSGVFQGPSISSEMLFSMDHPGQNATQLMRSNSKQYQKNVKDELNASSLKHVDKLLHQLLEDADIPNPAAWQKALVPILLRATDDIDPDVAKGESMDARHFVKLKRIPGGKPGDTSYVSGVVFTKNLALKSMARRISNPRIVLVTFPIEYQRHQQHFMSLQPVIEQEKEFLRVVVQRITNLRPQVLLAEKRVSGVALQYLSDANISVAYNVKHTVIEAVARCAETEIISSLDMLALPVHVGKCSAFEVRTFVNNDYPGKKKSYIWLAGCQPNLGCTIPLRGANHATLGRVKYIVEFMIYVVYNLKLESSLLRDEAVAPHDGAESSLSSSLQGLGEGLRSAGGTISGNGSQDGPTVVINQAAESEPPSQGTLGSSSLETGDGDITESQSDQQLDEPSKLISMHESHTHEATDTQVPDDVPMPTYYSDMVDKYETKILSASPYVKFTQPYLLVKAREQERRLNYLRRLRDHDTIEERESVEKQGPQMFQLIKPAMVEEIGQKAPRQIMEILHAVHDAEYDKALFNYQTQTKQWETYIQGNLDLFDPYSHQNIVVLHSVVCTATKIPCVEPELVAINFYDEQHVDTGMDSDCTIGQFVEDLIDARDDICPSSACDRKMIEHHRTYVHDQSRITVFVEHVPNAPTRSPRLGEGITMWTYCKLCKRDSEETPMSAITFKYSFGKYLELLYWGRGLRMKDSVECPHDHHRDHVRYFSFMDCRIRIHWDPIDLLEIVVPRARITWKVPNDLKLKNEIFEKMESRWTKFMSTVKARLKSIRIDSVLPDKAESCKADLDKLTKKVQEQEPEMIGRLQNIYVNSKYYEVVPFNSIVREMVVKAGDWDQAFAKFESDYLGDKDMRQLTMLQLKKMFTDNESKESLASQDGTGSVADSDGRPSQTFSEGEEKSTQPTDYTDNSMEGSATSAAVKSAEGKQVPEEDEKVSIAAEDAIERMEPLDLAGSPSAIRSSASPAQPGLSEETSNASRPQVSLSPRPNPAPTGTRATTSAIPTVQTLPGKQDPTSPENLSSDVAGESEEGLADLRDRSQLSTRRRSGAGVSPPLVRATSQPVRTLPRSQSSTGRIPTTKDITLRSAEHAELEKTAEGSVKVDKKLSERLGLSALKSRSKGNTSSIPRLVKKKESKVSTLARHFEQLSREFERERIRDRKSRAANLRQPRAMLPRTTTKAVVQVYDNVNEAFEEPNHAGDHGMSSERELRADQTAPRPSDVSSKADLSVEAVGDEEHHTEASQHDDISKTEHEEPSQRHTSQTYSDDEGGVSDLEQVPDEFLGDIKEIADALEPSTEIPLELPKHQKTSLMKYLTNFWAERSASGWPALEYPVNQTDHIFVDSDIIVREDEPSSVIALALSSDDYQGKLGRIRQEATNVMQRDVELAADGGSKSLPTSESGHMPLGESDIEKSLLRVTGTHLKYQFKEGQAVMTCKIFYAEQFDALRRKCGVAERIIESLSRCLKWDSRGGKTKSVFLKTLDDRFVLKSLSPIETSAFLRFAPGYFSIMAEALFHELPSVIAKMLGFYQVLIKNPVTGIDVKLDLLMTENLFYDRSPTRIFDLKGSMRNRKIQSTGEQNEVLLDENMVEYIYESPLFAREHSKKLLRASVWNDTLFLARQNVMDYSLMIAVDEARKELVVGIIDCIRTYTWDKKLESWIKDRGFGGGGRNRPTVTSPKEYKSRFREAMARYILQAPNCWHLFNTVQYPHYQGRARFEDPE